MKDVAEVISKRNDFILHACVVPLLHSIAGIVLAFALSISSSFLFWLNKFSITSTITFTHFIGFKWLTLNQTPLVNRIFITGNRDVNEIGHSLHLIQSIYIVFYLFELSNAATDCTSEQCPVPSGLSYRRALNTGQS